MNSEYKDKNIKKEGKVITVVSGKGGSGKTLICYGFGEFFRRYALIEHAPRILLVDLDFHVRGLTFLQFINLRELEQVHYSMYEWFMFDEADPKVLFSDLVNRESSTYHERGIDIIPSYRKLNIMPDWDSLSNMKFDYIFEKVNQFLQIMKESYNYIIIDSRAGIGNFSLIAPLFSDITLIVSEEDRISYRASYDLQLTIMEYVRANESRGIKGHLPYFVFNKITSREKMYTPDISNLPSIPFDKTLYSLYLRDVHELALHRLWSTSFAYFLRRTWYKMCDNIGVADKFWYQESRLRNFIALLSIDKEFLLINLLTTLLGMIIVFILFKGLF